MTSYIAHRVNTLEELSNTPQQYGVELDLRPWNDKIIIHHDPFVKGEDFEEYLKSYEHGTMILNIKSEGIEYHILNLLAQYDIKDYFFLDCSFPMIYKLSKEKETKIALRFSEFEGLDTLKEMEGKVSWVWVDCFSKLPVNIDTFNKIGKLGFKTCLVSPELQGREHDIDEYKKSMKIEGIEFDAICTKVFNIPRWKSL
ncbi:hypothetical protein OAK75_00545 [Bacteriovoracales bacterium]|nr:hypothetical protein [Bacteriovoracales bacterium]